MFRSYEEFQSAIKDSGIISVEAEFTKPKEPPNIVYFRSGEEAVYADGTPIFTYAKITLELYTKKDDNDSEIILEKWLIDNKLAYQKQQRVWITTEKWYETIYELELTFYE